MSFRAEEEAKKGLESAKHYLLSNLKGEERKKGEYYIDGLVNILGNVVEYYPIWHPLLNLIKKADSPYIMDIEGLYHNIYFVNGMITCPYGDGKTVLESVSKLRKELIRKGSRFLVNAHEIDIKFYNEKTTSILIFIEYRDGKETCKTVYPDDNLLDIDPNFPYESYLLDDGTMPLKIALPLLLEHELKGCEDYEVAESWKTMHSYFLGYPHGARSSLFINQENGQKIKNVWNSLINSGVFGPIYV